MTRAFTERFESARRGAFGSFSRSTCTFRPIVAALLLLGLLAATGCGNSDDPRPRAGVHGEVTLDNRSLPAGAIVFHCGEGDQTVTAYAFVQQGRYRIDAAEGPLVGQARVEFRAKPIDQQAFEAALEQAGRHRRRPRLSIVDIPPHYGHQSRLTADIKLEEDNKIDFHLTSRPVPNAPFAGGR